MARDGKKNFLSFVFSWVVLTGYSQNPIIQTKFTADPAPLVYHDKVFLYTSHDEDDAPPGMGGFRMKDWRWYISNLDTVPSLKESFQQDFLIGAAVNMGQVEEKDPAVSQLIARQFSALTPENNMKAAMIHPGWDRYNFAQADEIVRFADKYHLKVNAHCLIWHSQLPAFMYHIQDADSVRQYFTEHITTVAGRYDGKVFSWDVVNEALNEDGTMRKSVFERYLGDDYIVEAFRLAQKAAPHTQLYYNDYNIEQEKKREGVVALVKKIQEAGVRIDGVGIQGHWTAGHVPFQDIENSIIQFSALGLKVMFTELDLSVLPAPLHHNTADVGERADYADVLNPYVKGLPDSVQSLLADSYARLFRLFMKYRDKIARITFWGVDDGQSWLNGFPVRGRTNYPLLFDRQLKPKPAFYKVIETAGGRSRAQNPVIGGQAGANPILFADVPDMSMIRVGDIYYMSSTTMQLSPGLPIMKSKDLMNWALVSYAYDTLAHTDELDLKNGKSTYGRGSWASSLRYHDGIFYVSTFAQTTGRTYVYSTKDIEKGPWISNSFAPAYHDHSLFFDDDGRAYLITGAGKLRLIELNADASGVKAGGIDEVVIENASAASGGSGGLPAEGSQLFKVKGKYYLINITWPAGGMRTVVIHRADKITGPYEGRVALQDKGVAQGGLIQAVDSSWYAYLFRDYGAVGRIPYLVPVSWEDGWPVLGTGGKVPERLDLPTGRGMIPGIVASDDFSRRKGERDLPLVWQWNHNPDNSLWSVKARKGFLRLMTGRLDSSFLLARNTLTQRTMGPVCSGIAALDVSGMRDGDFAGLALLQKKYGLVGVRCDSGRRSILMVSAESGRAVDVEGVPLTRSKIFLKAECDFRDRADMARFYYSIDGKSWISIGRPLHMAYSIPHFMGYRFGLFNYAAKSIGGYADFDFFHIRDSIGE